MDGFLDFKRYADQVAETARWAARKGWTPAISTNFSIRLPAEATPAICAITATGIDKDQFDSDSVMAVSDAGNPMNGSRLRPSAETPLHLMLYRRQHIGAVLHTHSIAGALLSRLNATEGHVTF